MDLRIVVPTALTAAVLGVILASPFIGKAPQVPSPMEPAVVKSSEASIENEAPLIPEPDIVDSTGDEEWRRGETTPGKSALSMLTPEAVRAKTKTLGAERLIFLDQEPDNWLVHAGDYFESRWSPLNEINLDTVGQLGLAWSFSTGTDRASGSVPHCG